MCVRAHKCAQGQGSSSSLVLVPYLGTLFLLLVCLDQFWWDDLVLPCHVLLLSQRNLLFCDRKGGDPVGRRGGRDGEE